MGKIETRMRNKWKGFPQPSMKLTEFIMVLIVILILVVIEYSAVKYVRVINHLCQG